MRFFLFALSVCFAACHVGSGQRAHALPGVYVKFSESAYSKAYDTLEITSYAGATNIYILAERNGYTVLRDGQPLKSGQKHFRETAVFNPSSGQLQGLLSGRLFIYSPDKSTLLAGVGVYQKISEQ